MISWLRLILLGMERRIYTHTHFTKSSTKFACSESSLQLELLMVFVTTVSGSAYNTRRMTLLKDGYQTQAWFCRIGPLENCMCCFNSHYEIQYSKFTNIWTDLKVIPPATSLPRQTRAILAAVFLRTLLQLKVSTGLNSLQQPPEISLCFETPLTILFTTDNPLYALSSLPF